uniref:Integrase, catalytic region, zinc finger, CCHC-type, peptidase aspartic, catalytic n=1 Tax=Tanacetum cinerariifolium TaxID=118510 RepID=A0A699GU07_TANCI|nr:hypothetical protein [Tanacetum cinerariifolium]
MEFFWQLHSFLKVLSNNDLKGTRIEVGFERAFATLFEQDVQTFTRTMLLNLDQLKKHLSKEEFQELESFSAFRVLLQQFQTFLYLRFSFDNDEGLMICKYFIAYAKTDVPLFHATLIQHMESLRESILKRAKHKRENDRRVNDRMMQSKEGKVASSKALDVGLIVTEFNRTKSDKYQNQALKDEQHSQILNQTSNKAKIKKEIEVLEIINIELEHCVAKLLIENEKLHKENKHLKHTYKDLYDSIKKTRVQTKDHNDSLIAQINNKTVENADLKAQIQKKVFANVALKNELRKLKVNSVDTKFAKLLILRKPILQPPRNQSVVRQPNAFKSERPNFSNPRFASQVDVNNDLPKPVTPHYLPKVRESVLAKPHHVITRSSSRNSSKESYRGDSRIKVQSPKTKNSNKPVEPKIHNKKPGRQIVTCHRFSPNKSSVVHQKTNTPGSCLRCISMGRIFNTVGLRWVPTGKTFPSSTTKVDCEPPNDSNEDITNPYKCDQTLNVSAGPRLQCMTPATSNSGLVLNVVSQQPCIPPNKDDWDHLFQPVFDKYFNPLTFVVSPVPFDAALGAVDLADSPVSTSID